VVVAQPFVKLDFACAGILLEIRRDIAQSESHGGSFLEKGLAGRRWPPRLREDSYWGHYHPPVGPILHVRDFAGRLRRGGAGLSIFPCIAGTNRYFPGQIASNTPPAANASAGRGPGRVTYHRRRYAAKEAPCNSRTG
jgi:hypothetical protein